MKAVPANELKENRIYYNSTLCFSKFRFVKLCPKGCPYFRLISGDKMDYIKNEGFPDNSFKGLIGFPVVMVFYSKK
jgi:hypothetical protein